MRREHLWFETYNSRGGVDRKSRSRSARSCDRVASPLVLGGPRAARYSGPRLSRDLRSHGDACRYRNVKDSACTSAPDIGDCRPDMTNTTQNLPKDNALLIHAYLDNELDPATALAVAQQIGADPALAAEI